MATTTTKDVKQEVALNPANLRDLLATNPNEVLTQLQALKLLEEFEAAQARNRIRAKQIEQNLITVSEQEEAERFKQETCAHKKPNGYYAISGQRDANNLTHYICLWCNKVWHGRELPDMIKSQIDHETIGGYGN